MSTASLYRTRPLTVRAVQFVGGNADEIAALIDGAETATRNGDGTLSLSGRRHGDRAIFPGWWVSRMGADVTIHSGEAFSEFFEPA